jgi:hypothetical protein
MPEILINANVDNNLQIFSSEEHANQMKFKGVLVNLDVPSTKPPNGSNGKRILIPTSTAKAALHTLKNMGLNYTDNLDGHNPRKKVGVIKKAWIEGNAIHVEGIIWKRDFPEAEKDLKQKHLGMSFEATNIAVENHDAKVWKITSMCFTGASILFKKDAAYYATEALAAAKLKQVTSQTIKTITGGNMANKHKEKTPAKKSSKKVSASSDQLGEVLQGMVSTMKDMTASFTAMANSNHALRSELHLVAAGVRPEVESEEIEAGAESEESEEITAAFPKKKAKKDSEESSSEESYDESMSASAEDEGDLENMESDSAEEEDKPGHLNKDAKQKGRQTAPEDKVGKEVNDPILGSATAKRLLRAFEEMKAAREEDQRTIKKLKKQVKAQAAQVEAAAAKVDRRSKGPSDISAMTRNLLAKGGVDVDGLEASGSKMSVDEVDQILAAAAPQGIDGTTKMAIKSELARAGKMEEGIVQSIRVN